MRQHTARFLSVIALAVVALAGTACERAQVVTAPDDVQFSVGTLRKVTTVTAVPGIAQKIIGAGGDTLLITNNLGIHGIQVPAGAISRSAEFTLEFIGDEGLKVTLSAIEVRNGSNVGERGFKKPVLLCLNYSQTGIDPNSLYVAQDLGGGRYVKTPRKIYPESSYICGELQHFSDYVMAQE